jgi:hypothetical protein
MSPAAFAAPLALRAAAPQARALSAPRRPARHAARATPRAQVPPDWATRPEPPLDEDQRGPVGYVWDPNFPGTLKPGLKLDDCFPLEVVLDSEVYERMVYQELDKYAICPEIHSPDEDLLEWLAKEGKLLVEDEELEDEAQRQVMGVTEEDLDFSEEDDKMLAYYSKQGEGSSLGASSDFGGIAESGLEGGGL